MSDTDVKFTVGGKPVSNTLTGAPDDVTEYCGFCAEPITHAHTGNGLDCATDIENLLTRLTDDHLPGIGVGIARDDGQWYVGQEHIGLEEVTPVYEVYGSGDTLVEALAAAVEMLGRNANAR